MDESGDSNDVADRSGPEVGSEVGARAEGMEKPTRSDQFREDVFAEMGRPEFLAPVILGAVLFSFPLAWLIIAPVIDAFWPW